MKTIGSLLIALALMAGMLSCGEVIDNGDGNGNGNGAVSYELTVSSTAGGSVVEPGEGAHIYDEGIVVDLEAVADEGYRFVSWTGDVGTVAKVDAASTTIIMNGDYSITASFEEIPDETPAVEYDLTIDSTDGGEVTVPGEGAFTYYDGTAVSLVATSGDGYYFVKWSGDVGTIADVNSASTTITMNGNYSITAEFEEVPVEQYALTIASTAGGSVTTPGEGTFTRDAGTVVSLVASPASGYRFVNWTGNVGTIANVNAASTTIAMNGNYSITANFVAVFGLTIASTTGGSVTTSGEGSFSYDAGTVVSLVASPASGYRFFNWTGDVGTVANVNAASTTVTMNGNYSITANFVTIVYNLTISSTAGGSVTTPGEGTFTYNAGTVVDLVAEAAEGHEFVNWTGDADTIADVNAASTTITMNGSYSISAEFAALQYNLSISSTADGSVSTPGEGTFTYNAGTVVNLSASPARCCRFICWTGDTAGIANISASSTTVTISGHTSIIATFEPLPEEGEPIDCLPPAMRGRQEYSISGGSGDPRISRAIFDPLDVAMCAWQEVTIRVTSSAGNPVLQATGVAFTNNMSVHFALYLISGTDTDGWWQGYWLNEDDYCQNYQIGLSASTESNTDSVVLTFK